MDLMGRRNEGAVFQYLALINLFILQQPTYLNMNL